MHPINLLLLFYGFFVNEQQKVCINQFSNLKISYLSPRSTTMLKPWNLVCTLSGRGGMLDSFLSTVSWFIWQPQWYIASINPAQSFSETSVRRTEVFISNHCYICMHGHNIMKYSSFYFNFLKVCKFLKFYI